MSETNARRPRVKATLDHEAMTITYDGAVYRMADLPQSIMPALAMRGVVAILRPCEHPEAIWKSLTEGRFTIRARSKGGRNRQPSDWERAIADVLVAEAKKAGAPISLDEAVDRVRRMPAQKRAKARMLPAVARRHAELTGRKGQSVTDLFADDAATSGVEEGSPEPAAADEQAAA